MQDFYRDRNNHAIALSDLSIHFLGKNSQINAKGLPFHTAIKDARVSVLAHKKWNHFVSMNPGKTRFECEDLDDYRDSKPFSKNQLKRMWDRCSKQCALQEKKVNNVTKKKIVRNEIGSFNNFSIDDFEFSYPTGAMNNFSKSNWE